MKDCIGPKIFADLLIRRRRFVFLTIALFLIYTVSFVIFDQVVANEQRHFLRFVQGPMSRPGSNIHKYEDMYSIRRSRKARPYLYKGPNMIERRILRLDGRHDSATTDHWLITHYRHYVDPKPGRGGPK